MSNRFNKIADKVEEIADKKRKDINEKKAKLKVTGRSVLGIKGKVKSGKLTPKSKVARGMQMLCMIIAGVIALLAVSLNIWPLNLFNGADADMGIKMKLLSFIVVAMPVYIIAALIARPYIKSLEKKYGKQAW